MYIEMAKAKAKAYKKKKNYKKAVGTVRKYGEETLGKYLGFPFPTALHAIMKTNYVISEALGGGAIAGNPCDYFSLFNGLTQQNYGTNYPLGTFTSAGTQYPVGLKYLLGSESATGSASGVYASYEVYASQMKIRISTEGTSNHTSRVIIWAVPPDQIATVQVNTLTTSTVQEQPFSKEALIPPVLNEKSKVMSTKLTMKRLLGASCAPIAYDSNYVGSYNVNPANFGLWGVRTSNADGTMGVRNLTITVEMEHHVRFFNRNEMNSSAPA